MIISTNVRGILIAIAAFLFMALVGSFTMWGSISVYVTSYLRHFDPEVTQRQLITFLPIRGVIWLILLPIGSNLEKKWGPKLVVMIAGIGMVSGIIVLQFVTNSILFVAVFTLTYGIPTIAYYVPLTCLWKYYPEKKGVLSGLAVCSFPLGSLIFSYLAQKIVNPLDAAPREQIYGAVKDFFFDESVYKNVPKLFYTLSIIWGIIVPFIIFAVQDPPLEYLEEKKKLEEKQKRELTATATIEECPNLKSALTHRSFWIMYVLLIVSSWSDYILVLAYKQIGFDYHYLDSYLTKVGIAISIFNASGRLFWGFMYQKYYFKYMYSVILFFQIFFLLTIMLVAGDIVLFPIWIVLALFVICGNFVVFTPLCAKIYGTLIGSQASAYLATGNAVGSIATYFANLYIIPSVGYGIMLQFIASLSMIGYSMLYLLELEPKWGTKEIQEKKEK